MAHELKRAGPILRRVNGVALALQNEFEQFAHAALVIYYKYLLHHVPFSIQTGVATSSLTAESDSRMIRPLPGSLIDM